jgi:hypothetical protein
MQPRKGFLFAHATKKGRQREQMAKGKAQRISQSTAKQEGTIQPPMLYWFELVPAFPSQ